MRTFKVFSRQGCHLCEVMVEELLPLARGRALVEVVDVDADAALREEYGLRVPVLTCNGRLLCEYHLDPAAVEEALRDRTGNEPEGLPS
ncbi:MAG TPA: glutaredoxin family protein [Woeseiaceae bacterium]|nr:glutaredoxin family protein [Woeseiaceae bacterium]